jgi:hypothetical protein
MLCFFGACGKESSHIDDTSDTRQLDGQVAHAFSVVSGWGKEISASQILFDVPSYFTDRSNLHISSEAEQNIVFSCTYFLVDNCTF